jgi:hypothetical protein
MTENNNGVTVTLKAGTGYEAPWIVIHASDVTDALKQVDTGDFASLAERTVAAAEFFRAAHNVKTGLPPAAPAQPAGPSWSGGGASTAQTTGGGWSQQGSQQSAAPAAAPAAGKSCVHGAMVYREGTSAKGPWKAWFCGTPKGTPGQCSPEFIR